MANSYYDPDTSRLPAWARYRDPDTCSPIEADEVARALGKPRMSFRDVEKAQQIFEKDEAKMRRRDDDIVAAEIDRLADEEDARSAKPSTLSTTQEENS